MKKLIMLISLISITFALSPYIKGYKCYLRNIKYTFNPPMPVSKFINTYHITLKNVDELFKNNAKKLITLAEANNPKLADTLKKLAKDGKLKELKYFLIQVLKGKKPLNSILN